MRAVVLNPRLIIIAQVIEPKTIQIGVDYLQELPFHTHHCGGISKTLEH